MTDQTYPANFGTTDLNVADIPAPSVEPPACLWGDPVKCQEDNNKRATYAGHALKAYIARTHTGTNPQGGGEPAENMADLLSDLMHLADAFGLDFDDLVDAARRSYEPELRGQF